MSREQRPRIGEPPRAGERPRIGEPSRIGERPRIGEPSRTGELTRISERPRIALFTLGGTIASMPGDRTQRGGVSPRLSAADLIASVPAIERVAELDVVAFRQLPSGDLTLDDIVALSRAIDDHLRTGCAGAVVTQGTDTLEETAFALDILAGTDAPIVVTGAMRNPSMLGADGAANLLAALQVAASPGCRALGCLAVLNDEIHSGRYVRKTHTTSMATFRSPTVGPLGWVGEDGPRIALRPAHRRWLSASALGAIPPVALIRLGLGDDGRLLGALAGCGYSGVTVEALGGGHVPAALVTALAALAQRMPVVLASRTGAGEVLRHTYAFPGSEQDLLERGLIWAGALDGPKARVLLALALASGAERAAIPDVFRALGVPGTEDGQLDLATQTPRR